MVLMFGNASYHQTPNVVDFLRINKVQLIFTAPYSFAASTIECLFAFLKKTDLSDLQVATDCNKDKNVHSKSLMIKGNVQIIKRLNECS